MAHISDHDLERYHLGMVSDESELAPLEEHLLACPACVERAEAIGAYVDALRAGIIDGGYCERRGFKASVHWSAVN